MSDIIIKVNGDDHVVIQCCNCGVRFSMPKMLRDNHYEEGGWFWCPNGHKRGWIEGRKERDNIQRERDSLKQENARLVQEAKEADARTLAVERKLAEANANALRIGKRLKAGVCPCCNRSFEDLRRHMKTKHPDVIPIKPIEAVRA